MCLENKMPMLAFGLDQKDGIINTIEGQFTGTNITI
jgi:uridylate kinase